MINQKSKENFWKLNFSNFFFQIYKTTLSIKLIYYDVWTAD